MTIKPSDIDRRVSEAFDRLVVWARESQTLGKIAMQPERHHERAISDAFCRLLGEERWEGATIHPEHSQGSYRRDILVYQGSRAVLAVEVKTPFTNHDGIINKTRNKEHLAKDMDSLKAALDGRAVRAYYLITPIGCYPMDESGDMILLHPNSVTKNERAVKQRFNIRWPTRADYESTGKPEVERAMKVEADARGLEARKVKGWIKVELPSPQLGIYTFLDCALYKIGLDR